MQTRWIALGAALAFLAPAQAHAAPPKITAGPAIGGMAQVGSRLTATATWSGTPEPTATWQWLRCARTSDTCSAIDRATTSQYQPTTADAGSVLRVLLTVSNHPGTDQQRSNPTAPVTAASTTPPPAPPPPTPPTPTPPPTATP